jgi:PPM family protein phosphatase
VLIRALGVQEEVELDAMECMLLDRDVVLLCTDGLTRMVPDSDIARTLVDFPDPQTSADNLAMLANERGGEDNVSVIVVHIARTS